jgi:hypothetical protein
LFQTCFSLERQMQPVIEAMHNWFESHPSS